jgi:hypothetical protein
VERAEKIDVHSTLPAGERVKSPADVDIELAPVRVIAEGNASVIVPSPSSLAVT